MNDLYELNPANMTWTNLAGVVSGTPPSPRYSHGFASANSRLYVFGVSDNTGECPLCSPSAGKQHTRMQRPPLSEQTPWSFCVLLHCPMPSSQGAWICPPAPCPAPTNQPSVSPFLVCSYLLTVYPPVLSRGCE